jgi:hypothetical protein
MARYRIMTWQGIPAQVKASDGEGGRASREMPEWFAQEIDRVAMRDGLAGTDAYLEAWTWSSPQEREGTAEAVVDAVILELAETWGQRIDDPDVRPS